VEAVSVATDNVDSVPVVEAMPVSPAVAVVSVEIAEDGTVSLAVSEVVSAAWEVVVSVSTVERVYVVELIDTAVDRVPAPYVVALMVKVLSDGRLAYKSVETSAFPVVAVETEYMPLKVVVVSVETVDVPVPVAAS